MTWSPNRATLTEHTIVWYIAPNGDTFHLSGGKDAGAEGVWMGHDPENLGHVDVKPIFEAAAREWGEDYVGETMDHAELDIPLFILASSPDDLRRKREWLKRSIVRDKVGWLCIYTNMTGWRWVAVRKGSLKPALGMDPAYLSACAFDLVLIVERPLARTADHSDSWDNSQLTGVGSVTVYPGPEFLGWPQFVFQGPGTLTLTFAGNQVELPAILATEVAMIVTDEARPTIRARRIDGTGTPRNLLPLLKGKKFTRPCPADTVTRVDVKVVGGNANTALQVLCPQHVEGLV